MLGPAAASPAACASAFQRRFWPEPIDLNGLEDGAGLAALTSSRSSASRPSTANADREQLRGMVREERAQRLHAEQALNELREDLEDIEEEKDMVQRALRERTDQQKKIERDARLQTVIFRHQREKQQAACNELARRLVEAKREVKLALPPKATQKVDLAASARPATPSCRTAPPEEALEQLRNRLLQVLSAGGATNWTPRPAENSPSRPGTAGGKPESSPDNNTGAPAGISANDLMSALVGLSLGSKSGVALAAAAGAQLEKVAEEPPAEMPCQDFHEEEVRPPTAMVDGAEVLILEAQPLVVEPEVAEAPSGGKDSGRSCVAAEDASTVAPTELELSARAPSSVDCSTSAEVAALVEAEEAQEEAADPSEPVPEAAEQLLDKAAALVEEIPAEVVSAELAEVASTKPAPSADEEREVEAPLAESEMLAEAEAEAETLAEIVPTEKAAEELAPVEVPTNVDLAAVVQASSRSGAAESSARSDMASYWEGFCREPSECGDEEDTKQERQEETTEEDSSTGASAKVTDEDEVSSSGEDDEEEDDDEDSSDDDEDSEEEEEKSANSSRPMSAGKMFECAPAVAATEPTAAPAEASAALPEGQESSPSSRVSSPALSSETAGWAASVLRPRILPAVDGGSEASQRGLRCREPSSRSSLGRANCAASQHIHDAEGQEAPRRLGRYASDGCLAKQPEKPGPPPQSQVMRPLPLDRPLDSLRTKVLDAARSRGSRPAPDDFAGPTPTPPEQIGFGLGGRQPAPPPVAPSAALRAPIAAAAAVRHGGQSKLSAYRAQDEWQYEKVNFPGRNLKGASGPRKDHRMVVVGRAEVKMGALSGIYGSRGAERASGSVSRVQSLPSISGSRTPSRGHGDIQAVQFHGSPHRFLVHQVR